MKIKQIENWYITPDPRDPFKAPECREPCFGGIVDGRNVITSSICELSEKGNILTHNTEYVLGEIDPNYEKEFPNAKID